MRLISLIFDPGDSEDGINAISTIVAQGADTRILVFTMVNRMSMPFVHWMPARVHT